VAAPKAWLKMTKRGIREPVMDFETIHENAWRASKLLKAMSNQHRLLILCQLVPGEKCVGGLERIIGLSQSALSQHLARLRRDGLVKTRRSAQTIYYSLAGKEAIAVIETLYSLYCGHGATLTYNTDSQAPKTVTI
jgi:DNA-binding transcriptional ArsR family regulator